MGTITKTPGLVTLRQLLSEIRHQSTSPKLQGNEMVSHVFKQYRKFNTTDEQLCRARNEMLRKVQTYLCYLRSSRIYNEIKTKYSGQGERTVRSTADLVGFKLPHDPK